MRFMTFFPNSNTVIWINKYALLEQGKLDRLGFRTLYEAFPAVLIKSVVDATYANPYWLERKDEESIYDVDEEKTAESLDEAEKWLIDCLKYNPENVR